MTTASSLASKALVGAWAAAALLFGSPGYAEDMKVEIWTTRDAQQGALAIVAQQKGFLRDNGLDSQVRFVSSGQEIPPGMAGGTIPVAVAAWTNPMTMLSNGIPVRVLGQTADISAAIQVLVRSEAGIRVPRDLEGRKIGLTRISIIMSVLERGCATYGCDVSKMTIVNMQPQEIVLAYERGNVDAVLASEPWAVYVQQRGGKHLFSAAYSFIPGLEGPRRIDGAYAAIFARPDWVDKNPKAVEAVLKSLAHAGDFIKSNPREAAEMIGKDINIPVDVVLGTLSKVENRLSMTAEWATELDQKADYLLGLGELRRKVTAKELLWPEPLRAICPNCVTFK